MATDLESHAHRVRHLLRSRSAELRRVLSQPIAAFEDLGTLRTYEGTGKYGLGGRTIYINRGSPVLAIAHLDSVQKPKNFWMNGTYIAATTLDNRLGAWLMLYGLPALGIKPDVLLTENEECGQSTARFFEAEKEYNWAFSFDRTGDDVACYQYLNEKIEDAFWEYDLFATHGSYSDVVDLDIGVCGFNFGCGMYDYHYEDAYCRISELCVQVSRFVYWYEDQKDRRFEYDGKGYARYGYGGYESSYSTGTTSFDNMTDEEWNEYVDMWERGEDGVYRKRGSQGVAAKPAPITRYTSNYSVTEDRWYDLACRDSVTFFDGELSPEDWQDIHIVGILSRGKAGICRCGGCEEHYHWSDTAWVSKMEMNLCKACFWEAMALYAADDNREIAED